MPIGQDLNEMPDIAQQQLNLSLPADAQDVFQDLHPVIFNPVAPEEVPPLNGDDLQFDMHEQHLLQEQGEVFFMSPLEEELLLLANLAEPEEIQHQLE